MPDTDVDSTHASYAQLRGFGTPRCNMCATVSIPQQKLCTKHYDRVSFPTTFVPRPLRFVALLFQCAPLYLVLFFSFWARLMSWSPPAHTTYACILDFNTLDTKQKCAMPDDVKPWKLSTCCCSSLFWASYKHRFT